MSEFRQYRKKQIAELRPVTDNEMMHGLSGNISISPNDKELGHPFLGDMVARNPKNHNDQWMVAKEHFKDNFELM